MLNSKLKLLHGTTWDVVVPTPLKSGWGGTRPHTSVMFRRSDLWLSFGRCLRKVVERPEHKTYHIYLRKITSKVMLLVVWICGSGHFLGGRNKFFLRGVPACQAGTDFHKVVLKTTLKNTSFLFLPHLTTFKA